MLLVLLPLGGAALLGLGRRASSATLWMATLSNQLLSLGLACAMVWHYDGARRSSAGQPVLVQMRTSFAWQGGTDRGIAPEANRRQVGAAPREDEIPRESAPGDSAPPLTSQTPAVQSSRGLGPNVRFSCGVDGLTAWLVLVTVVVFWTVSVLVVHGGTAPEEVRSSAGRLALLLAAEGAAVCFFVARDLVLMVFAGGALSLLLGWQGGLFDSFPSRREAARAWLRWQWAGDLLLLCASAGLIAAADQMQRVGGAPAALSLDLDQMTLGTFSTGLRDPARSVWRQWQGWLFGGFLLAAALKGGWFPFHHRVVRTLSGLAPGTRPLLLVLPLLMGGYLWARFLMPLFVTRLPGGAVWLNSLALIGGWGAILSTSHEVDPWRRGAWLGVALSAACALAGASLSSTAVLGGWLLLFSGATVLLGGLYCAERRGDRQPPVRRGIVAVLAACGMLPAVWQLLLGLSRNPGLVPGGMFLGLPLVIGLLGCGGWSTWRWFQSLLPGPGFRPGESSATPVVAFVHGCALAPPLLLLLVWGFLPEVALGRLEPLAARYLRVEMPVAPENVPPPAKVSDPPIPEPSPSQ